MTQPLASAQADEMQMPARPDLIRLIIGIFGIGSSGPLIALSTMPVPILIFWRNLAGSLITLPFALKHKIDRIGARWAALAGVLLALHFICFFAAMRMTSVTAGTAIVATQPIFAAIFVKLTGGVIHPKVWLGMFISFLGVLVVTGIDLQLDSRSFIGDMAALVSGALAAAYMLIGSKAQKSLETMTYTTIAYLFTALTVFPMILFYGYDFFQYSQDEWLILGALILGAQILGHTMFNIALKRVSPAVVSMIVFFEVPVAAVVAMIFKIGKQPSLTIIPGVLLIIAGCFMVVLRAKPKKVMTEE
ncbi:RhaT Permeases of the drug/metabolite transporter (DMT) superfamily [Candidatus Nanopelagicaceae bacterium]